MHADVWIFVEELGFGLLLEVHVVPIAGRSCLQVTSQKMMWQVVPFSSAEDRQVPQLMLQPASLRLNCVEQHCTKKKGHEGHPKDPKSEPSHNVQQQDV